MLKWSTRERTTAEKKNYGKSFSSFDVIFLYTRRVQHNSDLATNSLWGQVSVESAPDDTIGSVGSADFSPVYAEFVSKLVSSLCFGDESNLLSKVKVNLVLAINSLNFDQTNIVILGSKSALVTKDGSVNMKASGSGRHDEMILFLQEKSKNVKVKKSKNNS